VNFTFLQKHGVDYL